MFILMRSKARGACRGRAPIAPAMVLLGALALPWLSTCGASAETMTWNNPAGGSWHVAANWDPESIPNTGGEEALVADDGETFSIDLDASVNLDKVTPLNPNLTFNLYDRDIVLYHADGLVNYGTMIASNGVTDITGGQRNEPGGEPRILAGTTFRTPSSTFTNNGTVLINPAADPTPAGYQAYSAPTIDGSGELIMTTAGNPDVRRSVPTIQRSPTAPITRSVVMGRSVPPS